MTAQLKILLVDPGSSRLELNEPIGIGTLESALTSELGLQIRVEQFFAPINGSPSIPSMAKADILGLSTPQGRVQQVEETVKQWRSLPPAHRPLLVLGGLTATFAADELLKLFPEALLVVGEGEEAIIGIAGVLLSSTQDEWHRQLVKRRVPNLVFFDKGQLIKTPRQNIQFNGAPPPTRPFIQELVARGGIVRAEASRGCSWGRCTFCAIQHKYCDQAGWRDVGVSRIVDDLGHISSAGVRTPYFTDEDFVGGEPQRAIELAKALQEAKASGRIAAELSLYVDMRVASILSPRRAARPSGMDVLRELRSAGLNEVFLGIESGSKEQVQRYKKPATAKRNLKALQQLRDLGINVDVGFIFFDPEMSVGEAYANLSFIKEAGLWGHDARLTKEVRLEAGTLLIEEYREKGLIVGTMDLDELTFPYRWVDPRMGDLHRRFRSWEEKEQAQVYALQAATRGEVTDEVLRGQHRQLLGRIRAVELEALSALVQAVDSGRGVLGVDLSLFDGQRAMLLDSWLRTTAAA